MHVIHLDRSLLSQVIQLSTEQAHWNVKGSILTLLLHYMHLLPFKGSHWMQFGTLHLQKDFSGLIW